MMRRMRVLDKFRLRVTPLAEPTLTSLNYIQIDR